MRYMLLVLLLTVAFEVSASQECSDGRVAEFTFTEENDAVAAFSGSDDQYTQGLRLAWSLKNYCGPKVFDEIGNSLVSLLEPKNRSGSYGYGLELGQNFFTPNDISTPGLIADDRPYAGWLYLGANLSVVDGTSPESVTRQHQLELQLGVVGPAAQGEFVQRKFHELIDDEPPLGWDNQLDNELGVQLYYTYQRRYEYLGGNFDFTPGTVVGFGSIQDFAGLNAIARFGTDNMRAFPVSIITSNARSANQTSSRWEAFVYVGAEARAMFHNIYLDGNNFTDSSKVDKEGFVYDLKAGFSVRYRAWRLSYTFVRRSREFSPDPVGVDVGRHDYGSLSISWSPGSFM